MTDAIKTKGWTIQPRQQANGTLPYPYHINEAGLVGRQDFWKGHPYKLVGFSEKSRSGDLQLPFEQFSRDPQRAIAMYPVFADKEDMWFTQKTPIQAVRERTND